MSAAPFGFGPPTAGPYSGLRRSVIDDVTGQPVVTSAPTGEIVKRAPLAPVGIDDDGAMRWAVPGLIADAPQSIASAVTLPRDAWRGDFETTPTRMSREEGMRVADLAGLAMTGSLPFKAPAGALRSFGGAAAKDDPLAALEAALTKGIAENPQAPPPGPRRLDPNAPSWDLYHGSTPGPDFRRFDPQASSNSAERGAVFFAPNPETASGYAGLAAESAEAGSRVFRASVEPGRTKVFDLADLAENDPAFTARAREITMDQGIPGHGPLFDDYMAGFRASRAQDREIAAQVREMGYAPGDPSPVSYGWGHIGAAVERAKAEGLDTAVLRGLAEHGGDDQVIALTPGRVRSHYDPSQILFSRLPAGIGIGAAATAALTAPDAARAAPSQGTSPVSASPVGFGAPMAPEDLARLFGRMPIGAPQGFAPVAETEADEQRLGRATGMVPPAATPAPRAGLVDVSPAPRAGAMPVPLPPARPAEFSTPEADLPATGAQPIMAAPAAPASPPAAPEGPSFGDRFMKGLKDNGDYLGALGAGLLSSPTWAGGISAGMQLASKSDKDRAATDLAKVELGLKQRKLAQETSALGGNAAIIKRAFPSLSDAEATAAGSNTGIVTDALKRLQDPNYGRENDPAFIFEKAKAQAGGAEAGKPDKAKWRQVQTPDGGTMLYNEDDPTQNQMLVQGQPVRPATEEELQRFGISPGQGVKMTAKDGPVAVGTPSRPQAQTFERPDGTKETRILNPRTGQWEAPDLGDAPAGSAQAAGNPYATGKFNNEQGKAAGFSDRMFGSEQTLRDLEGINSGFGGGVAGTVSGWTPNGMKSADRQRFEQAKRDFVNAQLRRESGAAISQKEFDNADAQYFPQPGDSADVIAQKRTNRKRAVEAMAREGGPSYRPHSVFDQSGAIVPYQPGGAPAPAPRQPLTPAKRLRFDPATGAFN